MSDKRLPSPAWTEESAWARWEMTAFDMPPRKSAPAAGQPRTLPPELRAELEQARRDMLAKARGEGYAAGHALGMAEGMQSGVQTGREQGYQAGFAEGHAAGSEASRRETAELESLLSACSQALESLEADVGQSLISLALDIARQVVRSTLAAEPQKILDTIRDIFHAESDAQGRLQLRVNPADLQLIQTHLAHDPALKSWRLLPDDTIERGGCMAETALGDIDATLLTRWRRITSALGRDHSWSSMP